MPCYHFHVMHGDPVILDPEGMDLPNLTAARNYALRIIRGPVGKAMTIINGSSGWCVEVIDKDEDLLVMVPFPYRPRGRT